MKNKGVNLLQCGKGLQMKIKKLVHPHQVLLLLSLDILPHWYFCTITYIWLWLFEIMKLLMLLWFSAVRVVWFSILRLCQDFLGCRLPSFVPSCCAKAPFCVVCLLLTVSNFIFSMKTVQFFLKKSSIHLHCIAIFFYNEYPAPDSWRRHW